MFAKVAVDIALDREFEYRIPEHLLGLIQVGSRVRVPFSRRHLSGTVLDVASAAGYANCKDIVSVIDKGKAPTVDAPLLELSQWMARYYCCPNETVLRTVLPNVVGKAALGWKEKLQVHLTDPQQAKQSLPRLARRAKTQAKVVEWLLAHGSTLMSNLVEQTHTTHSVIRKMETAGLVSIGASVYEREPPGSEQFL